ncbi:uncharacterized protein LOC109859932 isoform X2 [Pseudomyrmex gracilis]|uniref:uncharacterized protein LOC109859932 isoform X2 n=1 Tax=Pseudomyrmex gracilis TaxID=219809 RepID=UPI000994BAB3|nr:uncharacterized protein LOC109859932 isoform X2 [Pseudomyrmex gracilis]
MSLADVLHRQSTQLTIPSFYPIPDCFAGELRLAQTKIVSSSCIYKEKRFFLRSYIYKVRRCSFCQRLGHTASSCKKASSDKQFCERCGKSGYSKPDCLSDVFECINCIRIKHKDYKHQASDAKCHAYMRQKDTHKLMATRDLLFREASELFDKEGEVFRFTASSGSKGDGRRPDLDRPGCRGADSGTPPLGSAVLVLAAARTVARSEQWLPYEKDGFYQKLEHYAVKLPFLASQVRYIQAFNAKG